VSNLWLLFILILSYSKTDTLFVIYSSECRECIQFFSEYETQIRQFFPFYKKIDISKEENYAYISKFEPPADGGIPYFVLDGKTYNKYEFLKKFLGKNNFEESQSLLFPSTGEMIPFTPDSSTLYLVYIPGCKECIEAYYILQRLKKENEKIKINYVSSAEDTGFYLLLQARKAGIKSGPPLVYYRGQFLAGNSINVENIRKILSVKLKAAPRYNIKIPDLSLFPVISAALLDGINPCVFATFLFLITYLSLFTDSRKKMLLTLLFYAGGVLVFYFLAGIGIMGILKSFEKMQKARVFIKIVIAAFTLAFAVLNFRDYLKAKAGKFEEMTLKMSSSLREKTRNSIKKYLFYSAFLAGFLVSSLELVCTGEIYLPTILVMLRHGESVGGPVVYLLIYNFFFLIPLLIIGLICIFAGEGAIKLLFKRNIARIKLFTGIILLMIFGYITVFI